MPRISGTAPPTTWELWQERFTHVVNTLREQLSSGAGAIAKEWITAGWLFIKQNIAWIGLGFIVWAGLWLVFQRTREYKNSIQRKWLFLLYFLSKRHMVVPLVHTIAEREQLLPEAQLQQLLNIRKETQQISLRRNPALRMEKESQMSEILYGCFESLAQAGELDTHPKLMHIAEDLQFIDERLVKLQARYNQEAEQFNDRIINSIWGRTLFRRQTAFALFAASE